MESTTLWVALALALFWVVGAYNRLVRLRGQVLLAFQPLDARMAQFIVLLQEQSPLVFDPLRTQPVLVGSGLWAGLQAACIQFDVALRVVRKQVLDAESVAVLQSAYATLQVWWDRLVTESHECHEHPETLPASWQMAWMDNRRLVGDTVEVFNQAVQAHNAAIGQFPALVLARAFGFRAAGCL
jgi:LemA protein